MHKSKDSYLLFLERKQAKKERQNKRNNDRKTKNYIMRVMK